MYRHSPIRNPRSKSMKMKHVVQVLLLVAVCIWLIFQVKRSHDKRKEFDASDNNKVLLNTRTHISDDVTKFGRKYLHPKVEETTKETEIHQETQEQEDEEEHEEEEEGNDDKKHEEEEQDDDKIDEGEKDESGGGVDNEEEIDENEEERSDVEIDREEVNIIDEEEDKEEETQVNDNEEKDGQNQSDNNNNNEVSLADHDEDGSAVHTNEAREENYNGDDASSAVTHNGRTLDTKNEIKNGTLIEHNVVGQTVKNTSSLNTTTSQEKDYESIVTSLNATTTSIDSHDNGPPPSTIIVEIDSSTKAPNATTVSGEQAGNSSVTTSYDGQVVSNATIDGITQGSSNSTEDNNTSDTSVETDVRENLETNDVTDQVTEEESLDPDEVEHDPSHLDEKEVRTDLDTLPEIETEGGNNEDSAAAE
ncbi:uncharacterized protein [Rutidosis leptorrhynchoides]|uniref:uncharacterized protein n=1 Tax=Rutidosis leptorrhynchoides TaxID=125765 RepID=UPI003A98FEA4